MNPFEPPRHDSPESRVPRKPRFRWWLAVPTFAIMFLAFADESVIVALVLATASAAAMGTTK